MSDDFMKYISNEIFVFLSDSEKIDLVDQLRLVAKYNKIELNLGDIDLCESLPFICYKLNEKNLIGPNIKDDKLAKCLDFIDRNDLTNQLKKYKNLENEMKDDDENTFDAHEFFSSNFEEIEVESIDKTPKSDNQEVVNNTKTNIKLLDADLELYFKPFKFQISLAIAGCQNINNIICVRTGSGKTLIAALICKYWYEKYKKQNKLKLFKVAFIVPTRNLVFQQANAFKKVFDSDVLVEVTEKANENKIKDYYNSDKNILFLTPQKLLNTIQKGLLAISDFRILFFDECHHTNDDHPYCELMKFYFNESYKLPLIVGLTASIGTGKKLSALQHLLNISANLDCKKISNVRDKEDIEDLRLNIPSALDDKMIPVERTKFMEELFFKIKKFSLDIFDKIKRKPPTAFTLGIPEYENFLVLQKRDAEIQTNRNEIIAFEYLRYLNSLYLMIEDFPIKYYLKALNKLIENCKANDPTEVEAFCINILKSIIRYVKDNYDQLALNQKLEKLVETILNFNQKDSRGLILVRTRHHTIALNEFLNENRKILKNKLKAGFLVGLGNINGIAMNEKQQKRTIDDFRNGEINLLVSTDIAQEGLDIPNCNYVIRYEFVSNEIGTVQSRGRSRADKGQIVLITTKDSLNQKREFENRLKELQMDEALKEAYRLENNELDEQYEIYRRKMIFNGLKPEVNFVQQRNLLNSSEVNIFCRACNKFLFNGSHLKHRDPNYICVSKEFTRLIDIDKVSKMFYCSEPSCKKMLGRLIEIRNSSPFYMIDIKGIIFQKLNKEYLRPFSKWIQAANEIFIKEL